MVELLQKKNMLIGMTGDGVNDAPALKKANVGIAVHGCTDAARSAADVVLLTEGLSTIIDAIKTSRMIFQRMRCYALYRISSTVHFLIFFFFSISCLAFSLPAKLIVIIALLNDVASLVIAVDNATVSRTPDKWRLGQVITMSIVIGVLLTGASFAHYFIAKVTFPIISWIQLNAKPFFKKIHRTSMASHTGRSRTSFSSRQARAPTFSSLAPVCKASSGRTGPRSSFSSSSAPPKSSRSLSLFTAS